MQHTQSKCIPPASHAEICVMTQHSHANSFMRAGAHALIRVYQLTISSLIGRQCRHLPTCSSYADEAIAQHGVWAGGWMGFARVCRCHPWGTAGFDPVPMHLPSSTHWAKPWCYGRWRGPLICEPCVGKRAAQEAPEQ